MWEKEKEKIKIGKKTWIAPILDLYWLLLLPSLSTYTATVSFSDLCLFRSDSDLHNDSTFIGSQAGEIELPIAKLTWSDRSIICGNSDHGYEQESGGIVLEVADDRCGHVRRRQGGSCLQIGRALRPPSFFSRLHRQGVFWIHSQTSR